MKTPTPAFIRCKCPGALGIIRLEDGAQINAGGFITDAIYNCRRCWTCGARFRYSEIRGKLSTSHECNAKCLASKGPNCECSCAGKNHGKGWAA